MKRPTESRAGRLTGRHTLARPSTAVTLYVLIAALLVTSGWLGSLTHRNSVANTIDGLALVVPFAAVGLVVARRQPRNALGWILLGVGLFFPLNGAASAYLVLDYRMHQGRLPLGPVAVLLQP
ncbi:MAG: hypothetical protein QOF18_2937, partial [Frankiaceae bacterium]|nr:hypothetical protein [Frankiaceae bacterium]